MFVAAEQRQYEADPIRLVLADNHPIVLEGMQHLFRSEPGLNVLEVCSNDEETLDAVARHEPAVLVLDLRLPPRGGLAILRALAQRGLFTRVVIAAASIRESEMTEAVRLGAKGVVLKEMAPKFFVQCIRQVHKGGIWIENRCFGQAVERIVRCKPTLLEGGRRLTPRELEVVRLVADGLRNRDIVTRLAISEGTVKIHLHNIYEKLGTNDRVQLALRARDEGLV
jgi:DNA-binding NarL/FixJ family response regulator